MPCLNLSTNIRLEDVDTSAVLSEATKIISDIVGKPESPAAYGELVSIGGLDPDVNKKLSAGIADILENNLSIPKSRFFLKFYDSKANQAQEYAQCLHALHQQ
ncbi:uncharacterized protein LOC141814980 isoform X2 [Curcuma longa]|uniref:uncharacterized protein LOC141814980 isoform X2 n=1 Tax=Curcuma longa TaxID=136217 RepID=UPI003D9EE5ED